MRFFLSVCIAAAGGCASSAPALANVVISDAATQNMACSGGVCSPTASNAVLNVGDLEAMLASGNATVTTSGSGVEARDIQLNARLDWSAATKLSLDAFHSIEANSKLTVAGEGGISLTTNDGGSGGEFACNGNGAIIFSDLSSKLTINDTAYVLVDTIASLSSAIAANPAVAVALAKNYNARKDGTYTESPVFTTFGGSFNGLGNTISNLSINDPSENALVGLFAETTSGSTIANVRLKNENVRSGSSGVVGGLVANTVGTIAHSLTTGTVSGAYPSVAGGLLGQSGGVVSGSGSEAAVSGSTSAGGLVGAATGTIRDSWATGTVSGGDGSDDQGSVGGLVGFANYLSIKHSWASGQVSTTPTFSRDFSVAGGLVGGTELGILSIERSYATGAVTCQYDCGGLLGTTGSTDGPIEISQSFATGNVTSTSARWSAGGLVGDAYECDGCEIVDSYASGAVSGSNAGGLVGLNGQAHPFHSTISSSYSAGAVNRTERRSFAARSGGLIGADPYAFVSDIKQSYWDETTSGITNPGEGAGVPAHDHGIKGLSDQKLKSGLPKGFNPKIWKEDSTVNGGLPYLINNPPPK